MDAAGSASLAMNFFRLIGAVYVVFAQGPWIAAVGIGWSYGTEAFLDIAVFGLILILMWKGPAIRRCGFKY